MRQRRYTYILHFQPNLKRVLCPFKNFLWNFNIIFVANANFPYFATDLLFDFIMILYSDFYMMIPDSNSAAKLYINNKFGNHVIQILILTLVI